MGQTCTRRGCLNRSKRKGDLCLANGDDICAICHTDPLSSEMSLILNCGHVFHHSCVLKLLENRWTGARITFGFMTCPLCKVRLSHPYIYSTIKPYIELYEDVSNKALDRLKFEGLINHESIQRADGPFHNNPKGFAIDRYAYYKCNLCESAYFGGENRCENEIEHDISPEDCICEQCQEMPQLRKCRVHGTDYIEYKCRYCCSLAIYYCFGGTHFCEKCHQNYDQVRNLPEYPPCPAGPIGAQLTCQDCPLGIKHLPTGEEFAIGCGMCRDMES